MSSADVSHLVDESAYQHGPLIDDALLRATTTTPQPPPHPYVFSYTAGRYYGHIDRAHSEVSDGSGVVRGAFSYIDPKQQIRSVEYVADKNGFHPVLSHPNAEPEQSEAVKLATQRHLQLFNTIAQRNANVSETKKMSARLCLFTRKKENHFPLQNGAVVGDGDHRLELNYYNNLLLLLLWKLQGDVLVPHDTASVANAKIRHHTLYEQIAEDHARIAAEREAQRALFESTSETDIAAAGEYYHNLNSN